MRVKIKSKGFTLIGILAVIGIIAVLGTIVAVALSGTSVRARDNKRIAELNTLGRFLQAAGGGVGSYLPASLPSEGDLRVLIEEAEAQAGFNLFRQEPRDPDASPGESGYRYKVDGGDIVIYANLQNAEAEADLPYSEPTPAGGAGVFQGMSGWNGTDKYYQVSN